MNTESSSLVKSKAEIKPAKPSKVKFCNVANKPILEPQVEADVHATVAQIINDKSWREWGMTHYRKQGMLILLEGPPGTGKTMIASYLTQLIKRPLHKLDLGGFGSNTPGEGERLIEQFFARGDNEKATIFMDEAESILWDRSKAAAGEMWMVSIINKLLVEISNYKYIVILGTNYASLLDSAIHSRKTAHIRVDRPSQPVRRRLWQHKIPKKYPLQLSPVQLDILSEYDLTGRTIETAVIKEAQLAILQARLPDFESLCNVAKTLIGD